MKIGFIGLGNMGAPMARNLAKAGHEVTGFDVNFEQASALRDILTIVETAADAAAGQDVVITMLPHGGALHDVAAEIVPVMASSSCFIDCSTVDIQTTKQVAMMIGSAGLRGLDAPVSGGVGGASAGTLTFMVGGDADTLALARPLLDIMGGRVIHCGDAGAGQAAKICNNMILGATMIATCEAFALADQLGLDRQRLFDVVSTSSGSSWSMNSYCPVPNVGPQ
ncbi:MAG: NAD(P)-dependent oxidoreductase, partial [Candidatus Puniceispirillaceae bacterium]